LIGLGGVFKPNRVAANVKRLYRDASKIVNDYNSLVAGIYYIPFDYVGVRWRTQSAVVYIRRNGAQGPANENFVLPFRFADEKLARQRRAVDAGRCDGSVSDVSRRPKWSTTCRVIFVRTPSNKYI